MARLIKIAGLEWREKRGNVVFVHGLGGHPYDTWRARRITERSGAVVAEDVRA